MRTVLPGGHLFGFKLHLDKRCLLSVIIGPAVRGPSSIGGPCLLEMIPSAKSLRLSPALVYSVNSFGKPTPVGFSARLTSPFDAVRSRICSEKAKADLSCSTGTAAHAVVTPEHKIVALSKYAASFFSYRSLLYLVFKNPPLKTFPPFPGPILCFCRVHCITPVTQCIYKIRVNNTIF